MAPLQLQCVIPLYTTVVNMDSRTHAFVMVTILMNKNLPIYNFANTAKHPASATRQEIASRLILVIVQQQEGRLLAAYPLARTADWGAE